MVERFNDGGPHHPEPVTQIIPYRDTQLIAGLREARKSVPAIPADAAPRSGADLPPCDVTADVIFRAIRVQRNFRPFQHHQQLSLIGVQPGQQAIQRDEAGAA